MSIDYVPVSHPQEALHRVQLAGAINSLIDGKLFVTNTFTLTASSTTTTVTDNKFESNMVIVWMPTTANAAAAMTNLYVSARAKGSFTLTHSSAASVDRTFYYVRLG